MAPKSEAAAAAVTEAVNEVATEATTKAEAPAKVKGEPKTISRSLTDGRNQLQFIGVIRKNGTVRFFVNHRENDEKGKLSKSTRGASIDYDSLEAAKAQIESGVKAALKQGWQERKASGGGGNFTRKPDAFTMANLPKPTGK